MDDSATLTRLGIALAIGVLIGLERGWRARDLPDDGGIAGVRTFGLIGLIGAANALLSARYGPPVLAAGFVMVAATMLLGQYLRSSDDGIGLTTVVAGILTFALGAMAIELDLSLAVSAGVVAALLLGIKAELQGAVARIDRAEILAVFKLLIMTVVLLPVLPNRGMGPWEALNPFEIWLMVVLICALSFVGYIANKALGGERGVLLAGLAGGMVSSTATTIGLSRLSEDERGRSRLIAGAILLAWSVMSARTLIVVAAFRPSLVPPLAIPLGLGAVAGLAAAAIVVRSAKGDGTSRDIAMANPFDFWIALKFGIVLALVILLSHGFNAWIGGIGVYVVAGVSGLANVDAAALTATRMTPGQISATVAIAAVLIASAVNTVFKATIGGYNSKGALTAPLAAGALAQSAAFAAGFAITGLFASGGA